MKKTMYGRYADGERIGTNIEKDITLALDICVKSIRTKMKHTANEQIYTYLQKIEIALSAARGRRYENTGLPVFPNFLRAQTQDYFSTGILAVCNKRGEMYGKQIFRELCKDIGKQIYADTEKRDSVNNTREIREKTTCADVQYLDDILTDDENKTFFETLAKILYTLNISDRDIEIFIAHSDGRSFADISEDMEIPETTVYRRYTKTKEVISESPVFESALVFSMYIDKGMIEK